MCGTELFATLFLFFLFVFSVRFNLLFVLCLFAGVVVKFCGTREDTVVRPFLPLFLVFIFA